MKKFPLVISLAFLTTATFAEMKYIEIDSIQNATIVKVKNLSDFESLISKNNISTAFIQTSSSDLLINIGATYFSFPLKGYSNIADYKKGESAGYKNGAEYNEARKLALPTPALYYFYKQNNFQSVDDCIDANKNGFPSSTQYYAAKEAKFSKYSDYKDYLEYTGKGFKSKSDWQTATAKGFEYSNQFYESQEQGFSDYSDYKKAHDLGFSKNDELKIYNATVNDLEKIMKSKAVEKNYAVLCYYIQKLPKGEFSLHILSDSLKNLFSADQTVAKSVNLFLYYPEFQKASASNNYNYFRPSDYNRLNAESLFSENTLREFFAKVETKELGTYSSQSEIFKRK